MPTGTPRSPRTRAVGRRPGCTRAACGHSPDLTPNLARDVRNWSTSFLFLSKWNRDHHCPTDGLPRCSLRLAALVTDIRWASGVKRNSASRNDTFPDVEVSLSRTPAPTHPIPTGSACTVYCAPREAFVTRAAPQAEILFYLASSRRATRPGISRALLGRASSHITGWRFWENAWKAPWDETSPVYLKANKRSEAAVRK